VEPAVTAAATTHTHANNAHFAPRTLRRAAYRGRRRVKCRRSSVLALWKPPDRSPVLTPTQARDGETRFALSSYDSHWMPVEIFRHDDERYERWLRANRDGFVVNARQRITPAYLRLHHAWCDRITVLRAGGSTWTAGEYVKVCASDRAELERWLLDEVGGQVDGRCYCLAD